MEHAFKRLTETKEKIISESNSKKNQKGEEAGRVEPLGFATIKDKILLGLNNDSRKKTKSQNDSDEIYNVESEANVS